MDHLNPPGTYTPAEASPSRSEKYRRHLRSADWNCIKAAAIIRAGGRCEDCGETKGLQAHHLTYVRLGREAARDLEVLCRRCHLVKRHPDKATGKVDPNQPGLFDIPV